LAGGRAYGVLQGGGSDEPRAAEGILIVGVQGCGKSLAARVIARQWGLPLLKLDAGRIYDSLVGQSEKNFRKATSLAEAMSPDVLWIDEIEKGFAQTHGDADAGLSPRIFGAFLTWLNKLRFQGLLPNGKSLKLGSYNVSLSARDSAGLQSAAQSLSFTIVG